MTMRAARHRFVEHKPVWPRTAVKAATWHRVRIKDVPGGLEATVVLDV
jgi:SHS2 domain-containing protein